MLLTSFLAAKITLLIPLLYFYLTDKEVVGELATFSGCFSM